MEKEFDKCPFCDSSNIKPLKNDTMRRYKCESCGNSFGQKGGPLGGAPG